jgi:hypothetical protein
MCFPPALPRYRFCISPKWKNSKYGGDKGHENGASPDKGDSVTLMVRERDLRHAHQQKGSRRKGGYGKTRGIRAEQGCPGNLERVSAKGFIRFGKHSQNAEVEGVRVAKEAQGHAEYADDKRQMAFCAGRDNAHEGFSHCCNGPAVPHNAYKDAGGKKDAAHHERGFRVGVDAGNLFIHVAVVDAERQHYSEHERHNRIHDMEDHGKNDGKGNEEVDPEKLRTP